MTAEKVKLNDGDLTKGPIIKKLLIFFLPIVAGTLFQQLYNAVDAFVVSKFVGTDALASVGGTPAMLINLVIGFCTALAGGCSVIIAQYFGAENYAKLKVAVKTSYVFCIVVGLVVGGLIFAITPQILLLLKTTEESFSGAVIYQRIYFSGCIFMLAYNMGSGILRAVGDSKFPFICLFVGCGINIVLDLLFVIVFSWDVSGVAWATVIAQGISAIMVTIKLLLAKGNCKLVLRNVKFDFKVLKQMLKIGFPAGLQSSMYGFSNLILQIGINTLGTVVVASWAMSGKIDGVFWATTSAFGIALTTFIGQCYGARQFERIKQCAKKSFWLLLLLTISISGLIMLVGKVVLHLLTDDPAVIDTTYNGVMIMFIPVYFLWSIIEVYSAVLKGIGDTIIPSIIMAIGVCLFRIVWVFTIFQFVHKLWVLCICYPISWIITDIALFTYYKKKEKKLLSNSKDM